MTPEDITEGRRLLEAANAVSINLRSGSQEEYLLRRWARNHAAALLDAAERLNKIEQEIKTVHAIHGDDLCWMPADVNRIFVAAGLPPQDLHIGDTAAMRQNCDRYIACLQSGGKWKSYQELEEQIKWLKEDNTNLLATVAELRKW